MTFPATRCDVCPRTLHRLDGECPAQTLVAPLLCRNTHRADVVWRVCGYTPADADAPAWLPPLGLASELQASRAPSSPRRLRVHAVAREVSGCRYRGPELPEPEQPACDCPLQRLSRCGLRRGKGKDGAVTPIECHECASSRMDACGRVIDTWATTDAPP